MAYQTFQMNFLMKKSINILKNSLNFGIKTWDTSPEYGQSEKFIGRFIKNNNPEVDVSTKLPSVVKIWKQSEFCTA